MNFDDDDESDFNLGVQANTGNKLASLFSLNSETNTHESLKYKAPKQPQQHPGSSSKNQISSSKSSVIFFTNVQAFKYINNRYEPQGKLGLAILFNTTPTSYKLLLYATKTQPAAIITLIPEFKIALQKNNYSSFYDENRQLWSVLFDTEELLAAFSTNITLAKTNLELNSAHRLSSHLKQDLNFNELSQTLSADSKVAANDSVEIQTIVTILKDSKLDTIIENTQASPIKVKLGKNKLPKSIETLLVGMTQGDRRLFVIEGSSLQPMYQVDEEAVVFYDVKLLRIKKSLESRDRSGSNASDVEMVLPELTDNRGAESLREKVPKISSQLNDTKQTEKAKLISRIAKMGQQMMPINVEDNEIEESLKEETDVDGSGKKVLEAQMKFLQKQQEQFQQMVLQSQLIQQQHQTGIFQGPVNGGDQQLALLKQNQPLTNPQLLMYSNQPQSVSVPANYSQTNQQQQQQQYPELSQSNTKVLFQIEIINEKLDNLKTIMHSRAENLPNMETKVLLENLTRIIKENEKYKIDLYEKSGKIEEQNAKITELLVKAQSQVEQSHQMLEMKNNSYQTNSEKNLNRILELEKDKMALTGELSKVAGHVSELNLELNRMQKAEADNKQNLLEISKSADGYKQDAERLVVENISMKAKLDSLYLEMKSEKSARKGEEARVSIFQEELADTKARLVVAEKKNEEIKRKLEEERARTEEDLDQVKRTHLVEIEEFKEKVNKFKSHNTEIQQEQLKQIELELNKDWQLKLEKSLIQLEQKHARHHALLVDEKTDLENQLSDARIANQAAKHALQKFQAELDDDKRQIDDLNVIREKYERLQKQTVLLKERFEQRVNELIEAKPEPEVIGEEVKKVMNSLYRQLKAQIAPEQYYSGNGILSGLLKILKIYTIRVLQQVNSEDEDEEDQAKYDVFSAFVYLPENDRDEKLKEFQQNTSNEVLPKTHKELDATSFSPSSDCSETKQSLNLTTDTPIISQDELDQQSLNMKAPSLTTIDDNQSNKDLTAEVDENPVQSSKLIESSDEDGDDKSIQLINDDEQTETELILNQVLTKVSVVGSLDNKTSVEESDINIDDFQQEKNHQYPTLVVKEDENESNKIIKVEEQHDIDEDDDIDVVEKAVTTRRTSNFNENLQGEDKFVEQPDTLHSAETPEQTLPIQEIEDSEKKSASKQTKEVVEKTFLSPKVKVPALSKGLFDDSDDDENEDELGDGGLFKGIISKSMTSTSTEIRNTQKQSAAGMTKSEITAPSGINLKFSPPPLFDDSDDKDADKDDIDWYK